MQKTPMANRLHIGVYGRRNAGKSSLINMLTNQELAVVSDVPGTTTDPVYKRMELLPLGPVVMIDTAGIDDTGSLGEQRVKKTMEVIRRTDLALLVIEPKAGFEDFEKDLLARFKKAEIPVIIVINKIDLLEDVKKMVDQINIQVNDNYGGKVIAVSARKGEGKEKLWDLIAEEAPEDYEGPFIIGDLIDPGDTVILVTPIDQAAPKGRLILPQVQTIRDVLDHDGIAVVSKESELKEALQNLNEKPRIVVTDSQAFAGVDDKVPDDILLTSFSILFARFKGDLEIFLEGAKRLKKLQPNARVLIVEACTHRRTCEDIGTVKIPGWLKAKVGDDLQFDNVSGREYLDDLKKYDLVLHCGGCMLNRKEILSRIYEAREEGVPVINFGMAIAQMHGILDRALKPFPFIYSMWKEEKKGLSI